MGDWSGAALSLGMLATAAVQALIADACAQICGERLASGKEKSARLASAAASALWIAAIMTAFFAGRLSG